MTELQGPPQGAECKQITMHSVGELATAICAQLADLNDIERQTAIARVVGMMTALTASDACTAGGITLAPFEKIRWATDSGTDPGLQHLDVSVVPGEVPVASTASATGRPLLSNGYLGADMLHIPSGDGFPPHTHPGDHLLFVLGGRGTITIDGQIIPTYPGEAYMVEGAVPHAVGAIDDHILLSVGAPHHPVGSITRQTVVESDALLALDGGIACQVCNLAAADRTSLAALGCPHQGPAA